jgi:hypothetical protein
MPEAPQSKIGENDVRKAELDRVNGKCPLLDAGSSALSGVMRACKHGLLARLAAFSEGRSTVEAFCSKGGKGERVTWALILWYYYGTI